MRPRYLKVEGLQSFMDMQEIDFDKLGEMGLFGIFGPTGSGKSTILDAVTLALYGNIQRANRGTQGIINTTMSDMRVSFTFDLVKEANRRTYRVERVYKRKKDSDTSTESKLARIFEVIGEEERIIADKQSDVNAQVIELIGLQFDDFTRSVVLPQNKFQEFLLSPKAEKTKMLERIFYLEEYGRLLVEKINKKLKMVSHKCSNLEGAMSTLGDASAETLVIAEHNMKEALNNKYKLDEEYKIIEGSFQESKEVWEITKELNQVTAREQEHLLGLEQNNTKKESYLRGTKANAILDLITTYNETKLKLENTRSNLKSSEEILKTLEPELLKAEEDFKKKDNNLKMQIPILIEKKTKLINALGIAKEVEAIENKLLLVRENYKNEKAKAKKHEEQINGYKEKLQSINDAVVKDRSTIEDLRSSVDYKKSVQNAINLKQDLNKTARDKSQMETKYNEVFSVVDRLKKELSNTLLNSKLIEEESTKINNSIEIHTNIKPPHKNQLGAYEEQYHKIKLTLDKLKLKDKDIKELNQRLTSREVQIKEEKYKEADVVEVLNKYQQLKLDIQEQMQKSVADKESYGAYEIAKALVEGESCPVCGSKQHPNPAIEINETSINKTLEDIKILQEKYNQMEANIRSLENQLIRIEAQCKALCDNQKQMQLDLETKQKEYGQLQEELPIEYKGLQLSLLEAKLIELQNTNIRLQKENEDWEVKNEELLQRLKLEQEKLHKHKIAESSIKAQLDVNTEGLKRIEKEKNEVEYILESKVKEYNDSLKDIGIENPIKELERLEENEHITEKLTKSIQKHQADEQQIRVELEQEVESKNKCLNVLSDMEAEGRGFKAQKEEKENQIKAIVDNADIHKEINNVEDSIKVLEKDEKQASEHLNSMRKDYNSTITSIRSLQNQQEIYNDKLNNDSNNLNRSLKDKGFVDIVEAQNSIIKPADMVCLEEALKIYEEIKTNLEMKRSILIEKLKGRTIDDNKWNEISQSFENLKREKETSISQLEIAKNAYQSIKSCYEKWIILDKEMKLVKKKKEILEQIQKLMKGNSFIEFISEERLRYIAREASGTLGELTKYRYALELDTDNGFMIRDNANGGVLRMVSTLSGGETFLTSLSLALALSSQLQLKGQSPLEFFFLDEGFGTLDNNLLDVVIDSLERLSSTKRVIGLISHVPELKSRLTRRLIVDAPTKDGQGSKVRIEKA